MMNAVRNEGFGNARWARNLFEHALSCQALRLTGSSGSLADTMRADNIEKSRLSVLEPADFIEAAKRMPPSPPGKGK